MIIGTKVLKIDCERRMKLININSIIIYKLHIQFNER